MDFLAKVVLNLLRSLFLFNQSTEKNTDSCTKATKFYRASAKNTWTWSGLHKMGLIG